MRAGWAAARRVRSAEERSEGKGGSALRQSSAPSVLPKRGILRRGGAKTKSELSVRFERSVGVRRITKGAEAPRADGTAALRPPGDDAPAGDNAAYFSSGFAQAMAVLGVPYGLWGAAWPAYAGAGRARTLTGAAGVSAPALLKFVLRLGPGDARRAALVRHLVCARGAEPLEPTFTPTTPIGRGRQRQSPAADALCGTEDAAVIRALFAAPSVRAWPGAERVAKRLVLAGNAEGLAALAEAGRLRGSASLLSVCCEEEVARVVAAATRDPEDLATALRLPWVDGPIRDAIRDAFTQLPQYGEAIAAALDALWATNRKTLSHYVGPPPWPRDADAVLVSLFSAYARRGAAPARHPKSGERSPVGGLAALARHCLFGHRGALRTHSAPPGLRVSPGHNSIAIIETASDDVARRVAHAKLAAVIAGEQEISGCCVARSRSVRAPYRVRRSSQLGARDSLGELKPLAYTAGVPPPSPPAGRNMGELKPLAYPAGVPPPSPPAGRGAPTGPDGLPAVPKASSEPAVRVPSAEGSGRGRRTRSAPALLRAQRRATTGRLDSGRAPPPMPMPNSGSGPIVSASPPTQPKQLSPREEQERALRLFETRISPILEDALADGVALDESALVETRRDRELSVFGGDYAWSPTIDPAPAIGNSGGHMSPRSIHGEAPSTTGQLIFPEIPGSPPSAAMRTPRGRTADEDGGATPRGAGLSVPAASAPVDVPGRAVTMASTDSTPAGQVDTGVLGQRTPSPADRPGTAAGTGNGVAPGDLVVEADLKSPPETRHSVYQASGSQPSGTAQAAGQPAVPITCAAPVGRGVDARAGRPRRSVRRAAGPGLDTAGVYFLDAYAGVPDGPALFGAGSTRTFRPPGHRPSSVGQRITTADAGPDTPAQRQATAPAVPPAPAQVTPADPTHVRVSIAGHRAAGNGAAALPRLRARSPPRMLIAPPAAVGSSPGTPSSTDARPIVPSAKAGTPIGASGSADATPRAAPAWRAARANVPENAEPDDDGALRRTMGPVFGGDAASPPRADAIRALFADGATAYASSTGATAADMESPPVNKPTKENPLERAKRTPSALQVLSELNLSQGALRAEGMGASVHSAAPTHAETHALAYDVILAGGSPLRGVECGTSALDALLGADDARDGAGLLDLVLSAVRGRAESVGADEAAADWDAVLAAACEAGRPDAAIMALRAMAGSGIVRAPYDIVRRRRGHESALFLGYGLARSVLTARGGLAEKALDMATREPTLPVAGIIQHALSALRVHPAHPEYDVDAAAVLVHVSAAAGDNAGRLLAAAGDLAAHVDGAAFDAGLRRGAAVALAAMRDAVSGDLPRLVVPADSRGDAGGSLVAGLGQSTPPPRPAKRRILRSPAVTSIVGLFEAQTFPFDDLGLGEPDGRVTAHSANVTSTAGRSRSMSLDRGRAPTRRERGLSASLDAPLSAAADRDATQDKIIGDRERERKTRIASVRSGTVHLGLGSGLPLPPTADYDALIPPHGDSQQRGAPGESPRSKAASTTAPPSLADNEGFRALCAVHDLLESGLVLSVPPAPIRHETRPAEPISAAPVAAPGRPRLSHRLGAVLHGAARQLLAGRSTSDAGMRRTLRARTSSAPELVSQRAAGAPAGAATAARPSVGESHTLDVTAAPDGKAADIASQSAHPPPGRTRLRTALSLSVHPDDYLFENDECDTDSAPAGDTEPVRASALPTIAEERTPSDGHMPIGDGQPRAARRRTIARLGAAAAAAPEPVGLEELVPPGCAPAVRPVRPARRRTSDGGATVLQRIGDYDATIRQRISDGNPTLQQRTSDGGAILQQRIPDGGAILQQHMADDHPTVGQRIADDHTIVQQRIADDHTAVQQRIADDHTIVQQRKADDSTIVSPPQTPRPGGPESPAGPAATGPPRGARAQDTCAVCFARAPVGHVGARGLPAVVITVLAALLVLLLAAASRRRRAACSAP